MQFYREKTNRRFFPNDISVDPVVAGSSPVPLASNKSKAECKFSGSVSHKGNKVELVLSDKDKVAEVSYDNLKRYIVDAKVKVTKPAEKKEGSK